MPRIGIAAKDGHFEANFSGRYASEFQHKTHNVVLKVTSANLKVKKFILLKKVSTSLHSL